MINPRHLSRKILKKSVLISVAVVFVGIVSVAYFSQNNTAHADQYDEQIKALEAQNAVYSQQLAALSQQALTLSGALAELGAQTAVLQNQISISQAKYDKLVIQIAETELKLEQSKLALGQTLADMYIDDNITPIEMIASSRNISEYLDKQEYRNAIKDSLSSKITEIDKLKTALQTDKEAVEKVLNDQKTQRDELARRQSEQASLLAETRGQEGAYQSLIGTNQAKIAEARATQALINARINSSGGARLVDSGLLTSYPWNSSNCPMVSYYSTGGSNGNGGDGYGYGCRQCTSYVAWRIAKEIGVYYSWGDAYTFTSRSVAAGFKKGPASSGSIAVMDPGTAGNSHGHVAWVEAVSGNQVLISQYNYNYGAGYGMYSKMWLSVDAFDHYVKII